MAASTSDAGVMATVADTAKLIKQYAGERLYDTEAARYLALSDVAEMVQMRQSIVVREAASGRDITQMVAAQALSGRR